MGNWEVGDSSMTSHIWSGCPVDNGFRYKNSECVVGHRVSYGLYKNEACVRRRVEIPSRQPEHWFWYPGKARNIN